MFTKSWRIWMSVAIVLALIGFADASFLAVEHLRGDIPPCTVVGCQQVLSSSYAEVMGIPVALIGAGYYLLTVILLLVAWSEKKQQALRVATWLVSVGFLASLYFVGLQLFVLDAICVYCMGSALTTTLLAGVLWRLRFTPFSL